MKKDRVTKKIKKQDNTLKPNSQPTEHSKTKAAQRSGSPRSVGCCGGTRPPHPRPGKSRPPWRGADFPQNAHRTQAPERLKTQGHQRPQQQSKITRFMCGAVSLLMVPPVISDMIEMKQKETSKDPLLFTLCPHLGTVVFLSRSENPCLQEESLELSILLRS